MNKKILAISCIVSGLLLYGCPPQKTTISSEQGDCGVSDVAVDVNDQMMNISWVNNCNKTIAGYNIYISESKNSDAKPYNDVPFDGDTNPEDGVENFQAEHLENGKKYYVSVGIVNPDQTESKRSTEIVAVCGPRVEIELAVRYKSDNDGYSFDSNKYVRADNDLNDLYFFSKDGVDYLSSPNNLDGFLRVNKFEKLRFQGDFHDLRNQISKYYKLAVKNKIVVTQGDWVIMTTFEKTHALIKILGFSGSGVERRIKLFVAYSPLANELIF
ncbi:MAG TPA: hypothetical protein ENH23_05940 [candidate division Zixibacteria bacterium]|nr:hypothetical protein [candidate division Zixibacteria bacterium]